MHTVNMALAARFCQACLGRACKNAKSIVSNQYSATTRLRIPGQTTVEGDGLNVTQMQGEDEAELGTGDVFVDGEIKDRKTLRRELEMMGLSRSADPSRATTVAAKIRKQLQEKVRRRGTGAKGQGDEKKSKKTTANLRHQTRDLSRLDPGVVAQILRERVIYDEGDIVALDKPYGLPVHGGPGVRHNIDSLLPKLAHRLDKHGNTPELHLIHRLDKETTGVMLLARSEMTARILHEMFRKRRIVKQYLVITVGVPSPKEGILDMPMVEKEVDGKRRMVIKPDVSDVYPESWRVRSGRGSDAHEAITEYRVLSQHGNCALVQLKPSTGVKHQIRVHLAQGLGCPILGDHKYSHHNRLAPQRLSDGILRALGITQQKARTVPMHLHARQLIIPETFNGQNLFISTRTPWHFGQNMRKLKLRLDR